MYNLHEVSEFRIIDQEKFWTYELGHCNIGKKFKSPLRTDNDPSAVLFLTHDGNIMLHDFRLGSFNIWSYAKLKKINLQEFDTNDRNKIPKRKEVIINFERRAWEQCDKDFWSQYYITRKQLDKYNVHPIKYSWVNKKLVHTSSKDAPVYVYVINNRYKIYAPYHVIKWLTSCNKTDIQGYQQLPENGDVLIITKALKDVMVYDLMSVPAIAPQSESQLLPKNIIEDLLKRFNKIYINFDNDEAGIAGADKYLKEYNLKSFIFNEFKDVSDYIKHSNLIKIIEIYNDHIQNFM